LNAIKKDCPNPVCKSIILDILGAVIIGKKSTNLYRCPKCKKVCRVERTSIEQKLTQKYIDASKIKLKKK